MVWRRWSAGFDHANLSQADLDLRRIARVRCLNARLLLFMSACERYFVTDFAQGGMDPGDGREMASTESELLSSNPGFTTQVIHIMVQRVCAEMMPAKVHNYLPILITRQVRAGLRAREAAQVR